MTVAETICSYRQPVRDTEHIRYAGAGRAQQKGRSSMGFFDRFKKKEETTLVPGVGRMPYPAYRGREPYIFVSYAHADSVRVFREIARLNEDGYHVWYDEGIAPGNEWTDEIAEALANCSAFIV